MTEPAMHIVELTGTELTQFLRALSYDCWSLKIAIDDIDHAVKIKINNCTWSPPMGTVVLP